MTYLSPQQSAQCPAEVQVREALPSRVRIFPPLTRSHHRGYPPLLWRCHVIDPRPPSVRCLHRRGRGRPLGSTLTRLRLALPRDHRPVRLNSILLTCLSGRLLVLRLAGPLQTSPHWTVRPRHPGVLLLAHDPRASAPQEVGHQC